MVPDLRRRNFLKLLDFEAEEIRYLLDLAARLKAEKADGNERQRLTGRNIALIFEKTSTRTRCAFEVAAYDQGANVTYLGPTGSQIGVKESMRDTARVLARMYDGIEYRGFEQATAEELGRHGVPVWNGLTNEYHPTQVLADLLTMEEFSELPLDETSFCYVGDGRGNMGDSLMVGAAKMGMDFRLAAPAALQPDTGLIARWAKRRTGVRERARRRPAHGSRLPRTSPRRSPVSISSTPMSGSRWANPKPRGPSASSNSAPTRLTAPRSNSPAIPR